MKAFPFLRAAIAVGLLLATADMAFADPTQGEALLDKAIAHSRELLKAPGISTRYYDTYENPDGSPHAVLFVSSAGAGSTRGRLTLALSPEGARPLFFYFDEPFDLRFRRPRVPGRERVVVGPEGLWLVGIDGAPRPLPPRESDSTEPAEPDWELPPPVAFQDPPADSTEVIIPGVPIYLWYLNCALTSETMVLGYWADHGGAGLVPGGNSVTGRYYAITEELSWLNDRLKEYVGAREFGYGWGCKQSTLPNKDWATYAAAIETNSGPMLVTWNGPPYGAHSTVAVGYRDVDGQHYMALHDTWVASRAYVHFSYATSIVHFITFQLTGTNVFDPGTNVLAPSGLALTPTNLLFSPALSSKEQAWHCMEPADFNRDGRQDFLLCGFRNNYSTDTRLTVYTNDHSRWTRDSAFYPGLIYYECVHVARACDFDADGDADAAVTGYWMPVRIYTNWGRGLSSGQPLVVGSESNSYGYTDLAWGDFDRDGDHDLVACNANPIPAPGKIRLFSWQANAFKQTGSLGVPSHYYTAVRVRDLDGDSYPEIVLANRHGSVVAYRNVAGQFAEPPFFAPAQGHGAMALDVADIDRDGFPDIVTTDDGVVVIYHNGPRGLGTTPTRLETAGRVYAKDIALSDLNADGYPELILANYSSRSAIYRNRSGVFATDPTWLSPDPGPAARVHLYTQGSNGMGMIGFAGSRGAPPGFYTVLNFPVLQISVDGGSVALGLGNLLPGSTYAVERAATLGSWETAWEFPSLGSETNWVDPSPVQPAGFYRARLK